jgi:hypothetical protein
MASERSGSFCSLERALSILISSRKHAIRCGRRRRCAGTFSDKDSPLGERRLYRSACSEKRPRAENGSRKKPTASGGSPEGIRTPDLFLERDEVERSGLTISFTDELKPGPSKTRVR